MKEAIDNVDKKKLTQTLSDLEFPEWLVKEKGKSFEKFMELPVESDPLYAKYVDEDLFNTEDLIIHLDSSESKMDLIPEKLRTEIEQLPAVIVSIGGKLVFSKLPEDWKSKGVQILEGKNIFSLNHDGVKKILDEINSEVGLNKFVAMNFAFNVSPLLIFIPDNVNLEIPLIKIDLDIPSIESVFNQTLILLGKQSELTLIRELHSVPFARNELGFWNDLVAIHVGDGSTLKTGFMNALSENTVLVGQVITHTDNNANIEWLSSQLGSKAEFWKNYFYLDGEGSQLSNYECVFGDKDQNITLVTRMQHLAPHTIGRTFNRGVVKDNASISSIGIATVFNQAPFSDSNLVESSLIVGDNASANSFPFLEIDTSEVKAGHSASTSKLDEDLVFYVMSRGLPRDRTENILIRGYLEPTIQRHSSQEVRKVAHLLVQNKWDEKLGEVMSTKIFEEEDE